MWGLELQRRACVHQSEAIYRAMDISHFIEQVGERLHGHHYSDVSPVVPLRAAFIKQSPFGASVIAITDARHTTDTHQNDFSVCCHGSTDLWEMGVGCYYSFIRIPFTRLSKTLRMLGFIPIQQQSIAVFTISPLESIGYPTGNLRRMSSARCNGL